MARIGTLNQTDSDWRRFVSEPQPEPVMDDRTLFDGVAWDDLDD